MSEVIIEELQRRLKDAEERLQAQGNALIDMRASLTDAADALIQRLQKIIAEQNAEIERLKEERDAVIFTYNQADTECAKLRALLTRAADALCGKATWIEKDELIQELRKAAE